MIPIGLDGGDRRPEGGGRGAKGSGEGLERVWGEHPAPAPVLRDEHQVDVQICRLTGAEAEAAAGSGKGGKARAAHGLAPGASLKGIAKFSGLKQAEARVAKFLGRLARRRDHQAHTIARALVDGCDVLVFEDLDTKAMTATEKPNGTPSDRSSAQRRAMLDVAWGMIATYAEYKACWAGKTLVRVNPAFPWLRLFFGLDAPLDRPSAAGMPANHRRCVTSAAMG